ncbi:MAG: peptidase C45 [Taibaiella sp.]|nr:peptidase C45 [Taibaiella sp.]
MERKRKSKLILLGRIFAYFTGALILIVALFSLYVIHVSHISPPPIADKSPLQLQRKQIDADCYSIGNNWFRKSNTGLYELYVEGKPFERGVINGKLTAELVKRQEDNFTEQIRKLVPSSIYQHFLRYFIGFFNRNLEHYIAPEFKEEIYGLSFSASDEYGYIGTKYERLMNYHAAHDIGHTLQSMALVGCTSFATWNDRSADSSLIIGRNFDFYVGDKFAEDKIVAFYHPDNGYRFMMVTWAGFTGVVSGMNEKGITVTVNADRTSIPSGAATPVSLVAREILQYAGNIDDAWRIAGKRKMFVSESFLIGSAADNKAVVIEKTPEGMDIYRSGGNYITCTNHFQSNKMGKLVSNKQQISESASAYRFERLNELLQEKRVNTVQTTADILRDPYGLHNRNIGIGNEKAINQMIAHHSIIFEPKKQIVWVSTAPWQLGRYIAYDLNKIFSMHGLRQNVELNDSSLNIAADPFINTSSYRAFITYRKLKQQIAEGQTVNIPELISSNPEFFHTYELAGNYTYKHGDPAKAITYYQIALTKEIPTKQEANRIKRAIVKCSK